MTTPRNSIQNQDVADYLRNEARQKEIEDWDKKIFTGQNIFAIKSLPGNLGAACNQLRNSLDSFGKLDGPPEKWDKAVDQFIQELAIIAYKNKIDPDNTDAKKIKNIIADDGKGKAQFTKEKTQLYFDLINRDWIKQRVKDKLEEIKKNPEIIADAKKEQEEKIQISSDKKSTTSDIIPFHPLRWLQKRASDYWNYTKANPLKSLFMTATTLFGTGLFIAGSVLTFGAAPFLIAGTAIALGALGASVGLGGLGFNIKRDAQELELKNLSPEEVEKKQQEKQDNFNESFTSTARLASKLYSNNEDMKNGLRASHQENINEKPDQNVNQKETKSQKITETISHEESKEESNEIKINPPKM